MGKLQAEGRIEGLLAHAASRLSEALDEAAADPLSPSSGTAQRCDILQRGGGTGWPAGCMACDEAAFLTDAKGEVRGCDKANGSTCADSSPTGKRRKAGS